MEQTNSKLKYVKSPKGSTINELGGSFFSILGKSIYDRFVVQRISLQIGWPFPLGSSSQIINGRPLRSPKVTTYRNPKSE